MTETAEYVDNRMAAPSLHPHPSVGPAEAAYVNPPTAGLLKDPRRKSPLLATVLSVMPGLGQVYVGYYKRGFIHAIVIATLISILRARAIGPLIPVAAFFMAFFWLYNLVDAGRRAALYNQALAGGGEIDLPGDFSEPGFRGTIFGGACLIALGVVLLSNTLLGLPLDWIQSWWPVTLIVFGGYLAYKAVQDRSSDPLRSTGFDTE